MKKNLTLLVLALLGFGFTSSAATLVNVSPGTIALATMSSDIGYPAYLAFDRNYGNFTHTAGGASDNWWRVDLGGPVPISYIVLFNRTSCCGDRLRDITIGFYDTNNILIVNSPVLNPGGTLGSPASLAYTNATPVNARYVQVTRSGSADNVLSLAEVEIYATNLAYAQPATQSSEWPGLPAGNANNGNPANYSHTTGSPTPTWWRVDLGTDYEVNSVLILNRPDCCPGRLRDITVSVLDANLATVYSSPLLNPANALGGGVNDYGTGPKSLGVDIRLLNGGPIVGRYVRVTRTANGGADDNTVLALAEVQVYGGVVPARISTQPQNQYAMVGGTATFTVGAGGTAPLYYQWFKNGTFSLANQTNATLTLTNLTLADAGNYSVTVTNAYGTTNSSSAALAVYLWNVARFGTASQSTTDNGGVASRANDGNTDGNWGNGGVTHTGNTPINNEWWEVDLGVPTYVDRVYLWFRTDCCQTRNEDLRIVIYDGPVTRNVLWTQNVGTSPGNSKAFDVIPPVLGRVVRVEHPSGVTNVLSLAEVQVFEAFHGANLVWTGNAGPAWDLTNTVNWLAGVFGSVFHPKDIVTFDNSSSHMDVSLVGTLGPLSVNVSANQDYLFQGSGKLIGGALTKSGTGMLTLANTDVNVFGSTLISQGTLQIGNGGTAGLLTGGGISNNATLIFNHSDSLASSMGLSGSGLFIKKGVGTLTLTAQPAYTGNTIVSNGVLEFNSPGVFTYNGGDLFINNGSTLKFSGSRYDISGKTITFDSAGGSALDTSSGLNFVAWSGNTFRTLGGAQNSILGASGMNINSGVVDLFDITRGTGASDLKVIGPIFNAGGIAKKGNGILELAGVNTYTANTIVSNGTLKISGGIYRGAYSAAMVYVQNGGVLELDTWAYGLDQSLGQLSAGNQLQIDNGTIRVNGTTTYGRGLTVLAGGATFEAGAAANWGIDITHDSTPWIFTGNPSLRFTGAGNGVFQKDFTSGGALTKDGTGTWTLAGTNNFGGGLALNMGSLFINGASTGTVAVAAGTTLGGSGILAGAVAMPDGSVLVPGSAPGAIGTLTVNGLSVTNVYLDYQLGATADEGAGINDLIQVNGNLALSGVTTVRVAFASAPVVGQPYTLINYTGAFSGDPTNLVVLKETRTSFLLDFSVTNKVRLIITEGTGNLTWVGLNLDNNWDTTTTTNWDNNVTGPDIFYPSDAVNFGNDPNSWTVDLVGTLRPAQVNVLADQDYLFQGSGKINGAQLNKSGNGTLTFANSDPNDFPLGTTISAGTLQIGNGGTAGVLPTGPLTNNAMLAFYRSDDITIPNLLVGTGSVRKDGTNILTLTAANTYGGDTIVSLGTLKLGAANVIPDGAGKGNLSLSGLLNLNALSETVNGLSGTGIVDTLSGGTPILTVGNGDATSVFAGSLRNANGALALTKTGAGTLTLSGTNTHSGTTTVSAGTLVVTNGGAITTVGALNVGGTATGTLTIDGGSVASTYAGNRTLNIGAASSSYGTNNLVSGSLWLTGSAGMVVGDSGTGTFNQTGGSFLCGNSGIYVGDAATGVGFINLGGGTFTNTAAPLILATRGTGTLTVSNTALATLATLQMGHSASASSVSTVNLDGGILTVNNVARANGTATFNFNGGTLRAATGTGSLMTGLSAANVKNGGAVIDDGGYAINIDQPLLNSGSGGLTKLGAGTLALRSTNSYVGPTIVSNGVIEILAPGTYSGGATVASGALRLATALPVTDGLVARLDADALSGLANGDVVNSWNDTSVAGNNATRANGAPTYQTGVQNGRPVVRFPTDGVSWLNFATRRTDVRTVFMVAKETSPGQHFLLGDSADYHFHRGGGPSFYLWGEAPSGNITGGTTRMNGAVIDGTATSLGMGWNLIDVVTVGNVSVSSVSQDRNYCCGGRSWAGDIAEVLIYNTALTPTQVQQVEEYLNSKWFGILAPAVAINGAVSVATNAAFGGNGAAVAATVDSGGIIEGGYHGSGTLTLSNLTFNGTGAVKVTLAAGSTPIVVTNALSVGGMVTVVPQNSSMPPNGTYHVLQYPGALVGDFTLPPGHGYALATNTVGSTNYLDVVVDSSYATLTWVGGGGDPADGWNLASTPNWDSVFYGQTVFYNADTVAFDNGSSFTTVNLAGLLQPSSVNVSADQDYLFTGSGVINGGTLNKSGVGTLTLANSSANTFSGGTLVSDGTLRIGNGGTTGVPPNGIITINDPGTLVFDRSDDLTNASAFTGTGYVRKDGTNTLTLSSGNTHGGTVVSSGTLKVQNNAALGNIGAITIVSNGATLDILGQMLWDYTNAIVINGLGVAPSVGALTKSEPTQIGANQIRNLTLGSDASLGGVTNARFDIGRGDWNYNTGNAPIHLDGQGHTLSLVGHIYFGILAGAQNLSGLIINSNTVVAPHAANAMGSAIVALDGGTLSPWGTHDVPNPMVVNSGFIDNQGAEQTYSGPVQINGPVQVNTIYGGNITFAGNITGAGIVNKIGAYSLFLGGDNSGFAGTFTNNESNTFFTNAASGSASATWVLNSGNLGSYQAGTPTIHLGALSGTGGLLGNNTAGAAVTFSIGALGGIQIFGGSILDSVGGGGTAAITKTGAGTQILSGANNYTGGTLVQSGTLQYDGTQNASAGTVTVAGGALTGNGTLHCPVVVQVAGTLAPGASIGTLTINNTLSLAGSTVMEINKSGVDLTNDAVKGVSTLTYGGTLTVTASGDLLALGDSFQLFAAGSYVGSFASFNLPDLGDGLAWDNSTLATDGTIRVGAASPISGTVALEYFAGLAHDGVGTRDVTFKATVGNTVVGTWTLSLNFINGVANYTLPKVLASSAHLSAKGTSSLRKRATVSFSEGVNFVLPGGDFDGSNLVDIQDYFALAASWYQANPATDIDGSGRVDLDDYFILASHWYEPGEAE